VEVALVQLTRQRDGDAGGHDVAALAARVAKLENAAASAPAVAPAPVDPTTGRAKLGGRAQRAVETASPTTPGPTSAPPAATPAEAAEPSAAPAQPATASTSVPSGGGDLRSEWFDQIRPGLRGLAKALYAAVEFVSAGDDRVVLSAPNAAHREKCQAHVTDVEKVWRDSTGRTVHVSWADADSSSGVAARPSAAPSSPPSAEPTPIDDHELDDHEVDESRPAIVGNESVLNRLAEAFPGAERVEGER
jgi:DNA polymerase-3 subunit gamma/tau